MKPREIKFRAFQDNQMLVSPISSNYGLQRFFGFLYEDTPVMQFTGLRDKNGTEIFEGDVLKAERWKYNWVVQFDRVKARFNCIVNPEGSCNDYIPDSVVVIGNIYEHPELINQ